MIAVGFDSAQGERRALDLASRLRLPLAKKFNDPRPMRLVVADSRLELRVVKSGHPLAGGRGVYAELTQLDTTSPAGRSLKTPLLKAVGIHKRHGSQRPEVLDTTAGLGEDTWLLAAAGCRVTAIERHPVVHALLADALQRADTIAPDVVGRITLLPCTDAAALMRRPGGAGGFDVVLIDPMFPGAARRKTTERKPMRMLRWLVGDDQDADDLLELGLETASKRVVVKRPKAAPHLAAAEPVAVHAGRGLRFEVYPVLRGQPKLGEGSGR